MTDRELLELAAKAAGLHIKGWRTDTDDKFTHLIVGAKFTKEKIGWNPLTDDGDALRLAVNLCMTVSTGPCVARASTIPGTLRGTSAEEEIVLQDQSQAVRRAIVRAAAEIGKGMQ